MNQLIASVLSAWAALTCGTVAHADTLGKPAAHAARLTVPSHNARLAAPRTSAEARLTKKEDTVAGGTHWRVSTAQGAVHVWIPQDYDRDTAGTVV